MALTPDVTAGTIIQSAWGNQIRDRTVQSFATIAERSTWAAPPKGALCVTTDTNIMWQWSGTAWVPAVAGGRVGYVENATPPNWAALVQTVATLNDVPVIAGRMYSVRVILRHRSDTAGMLSAVEINRGPNGAALAKLGPSVSITAAISTGANMSEHLSHAYEYVAAVTGLDDFNATVLRQTGAGTGSSTFASLAVFDCGPS